MIDGVRHGPAATDVFDIWDTIAEGSIERADRCVDKLGEELEVLESQPLMGRAKSELVANVRRFPFRCYVISF